MLKIRLSDEETKLLKNIFGTLQKIDDKLMIKATPTETRLSACSGLAFMSVTCPAETFKNYDVYTTHALHAIIPFNNLNFLKKARPEESTLKLEGPDKVLRSTITMRCENGLVKTYSIPTIDGKFFDEEESRSSCPIQIVTKPEKLLKPISLFHSSITQMALQVRETQGVPRIQIRSIPDRDESKNIGALHAKVLMDPESQFIKYTSSSVAESSMEILFSAKEVKAMLNLCTLLCCEAVIEYSKPGDPFFMEANALFQGVKLRIRLILATIGEPNEAPSGVGQAAYAQENIYERHEPEDDMEYDEAEDEERGSNVPNTPPEHMDDDRAHIPGYISSCCRAVRSADHFNNVESVVAEECTVAPTLDSSMMRSKSEIRILQKPIPQNYHGIVAKARPRSLFEASAIRVAKHSSNKRHMTGQPDTDDQGIPARFMDAYLAALRDSNVRWASESEIAGLFTEHARLIGQDKQVTVGKAAVLKRLDQGVETLIKMAGKDASLPEFEVKGPILTEALAHRYECTIKRGAFKFAFAQEFIIIGGKISQLSSSRI